MGFALLVLFVFAPLGFMLSAVDLVLRVPGERAPTDGGSLEKAPFASVNLDDWRGAGFCRIVLADDGLIIDAYGLFARKIPFSAGEITMGIWNAPGEWNFVVPASKKRFTFRASTAFAALVIDAFGRWERAQRVRPRSGLRRGVLSKRVRPRSGLRRGVLGKRVRPRSGLRRGVLGKRVRPRLEEATGGER